MIAIELNHWYTKTMKQLVAILCGIIIVLGLFFVGFFEQLVFFVLVGRIPFTEITLSATTMLIVWLAIIPGLLINLPLLSKLAWSSIDKIGLLNQRKINTRWNLRQKIERIYSVNLIAVTMLDIAAQIPDSSTDNPELYLRRRFMPLPA